MILGVMVAAAGGGAAEVNVILATQSSPFFDAYKWTAGFGTKYSNPATLPSFAVGHVDFAPNGTAIAATYNGTSSFVNSLIAWDWSGSGFGTKFSDPSSPSAGYGVAFRPGTNAVVRSVSVSPFIEGFPWSGSGFGTKYANPASLPPAAGQQVAFTSSGNDVAMAHNSSPRISAWSWSSGFGTRYANPATLPPSDGRGVSFHPNDNAIAVTNIGGSPWVQAYPWSGSGFGTKYADPSTGLGETVAANGTAFSRNGSYIGIASNSSPFIHVYNWASGFGTKFSNPASLPAGTGFDVDWTPTSDAILLGHATSPFVSSYPFSGSGFGTRYANPSTLPNGQSNGVSFSK